MVRMLAVIDRDLKKFRRNPLVVGMSVLMPLLYLVILGNSFQGKLRHLPLAVVDLDPGPSSRRLVENLSALESGALEILAMTRVADQQQAVAGVAAGTFKGALVIPPRFSKRRAVAARPEVGLFLDNSDNISADALRGAVQGAVNAIPDEHIAIRESNVAVHVRDVNLYPKVDYFQSLVPGVVIMAIFLGALTTGAFNLVMDRFLGVDESYLLTPLTKTDIVGGLIVSGLFITTTMAFVIFVASMWITGIPLAHWLSRTPMVLLIVVLTTLGLQSLMFFILGQFHHPRIVGILSGFLNVILFFPSGAVYPIASFPGWLRGFARFNPEAYAVHALKAVLFKGAGLMTIAGDILFLLVFTAIMLVLAVVTFQRAE
ncbi:MAG: ABC transporter permease [Thermodesulfobacteriota bacterium]